MIVELNLYEWWQVAWTEHQSHFDQRQGHYTMLANQSKTYFFEHEAEAKVEQLLKDPTASRIKIAKWTERKKTGGSVS